MLNLSNINMVYKQTNSTPCQVNTGLPISLQNTYVYNMEYVQYIIIGIF
jgi:hypothetical protein